MRRPERIPAFSKALLAAALTGLAATIANLIYNVVFRSITQYFPSEEFNFLSITIASMLVFLLIGMLFFFITKISSVITFDIILVVLALICIGITTFLHPPNQPILYGNHGLIAGFVLISGLLAIILLPYLYNHPRLFI